MGEMRMFIDVSKCMACRGCQVSCKQWNGLKGEKTTNTGSYQNPPDMTASTWTVVKFKEVKDGGKVKWNFFKDQCRHCLEPPCLMVSQVKGSIIQDRTGAVVFTDLTKKENFKDIHEACPYNIPRLDEASGRIYKCTLCIDRISNGLEPACAKTCPPGAIKFGKEKEILKMARDRLKEVKARYPDASLVDEDSVTVIYLLTEKKENYQISEKPHPFSSLLALKKLLNPWEGLGIGSYLRS